MPKEQPSRDPVAHAAQQAQAANAALQKQKEELEVKNFNLQQQLHQLLQAVDPKKRKAGETRVNALLRRLTMAKGNRRELLKVSLIIDSL